MHVNQPEALSESGGPEQPPKLSWHQKFGILLLVVFCFEVGMFLLIFPWLRAWELNWFAGARPWARALWLSPYFRGALSGLGLLNIYIAFLEILRLRRP